MSWLQPTGAVPSLRDIQRALVELGDKPPSFANSRQWIGAVEVSMCLDHFCGVSCRIVHVTSGAQVVDALPMLQKHFESGGAPVMIGGGVKAYTIIGVRPSVQHLLILDPHFEGSDRDLAAIRRKWCTWRHPSDLFAKGDFFNLCVVIKQ